MSRKRKLLLNMAAGIGKQIVTVVCGFILPRYMLLYYGSSVNGLISSITHYLSFISLLDMGVGAVVQSNLYKPLADNDKKQISLVVKAAERFFRKLACIFIVYICLLCFVYPTIVNKTFDALFIISLLLIISISTLAQYLFGITYQLLLNADQKSYVHLSMQIGTTLLCTALSIVLMRFGMSIQLVKLISAFVYIVRPLGQMIYVHKHYDLSRKIELSGEPIKQKWNGFSQHMAAVVCKNVDVSVLTFFSLESVSIYSVYYNVTSGVEQIIMTAATGLESLFGNMIARNEMERLRQVFSMVEWGIHAVVTFIFTIAGITIVPFVIVYTKGINDANYVAPLFGALIVLAYGVQCLRVPYFRIIKAAGHFKQTQNGAYISAFLNIIITIFCVFRYGLIGAALGTFVAMMYHTCYFAWYLRKNILNRPIMHFLRYLLIDALAVFFSWLCTREMVINPVTYADWAVFAIKVTFVVFMVNASINILFSKKIIVQAIRHFIRK